MAIGCGQHIEQDPVKETTRCWFRAMWLAPRSCVILHHSDVLDNVGHLPMCFNHNTT